LLEQKDVAVDNITINEILKTVLYSCLPIAAWFATYFGGKPILDFREKRREALEIAERYAFVSLASSDEYRSRAVKALFDVGNTLRGYNREQSVAIRVWCRLCRYDLDLAARALLGLGQAARGEFRISKEVQENTRNTLLLALGATHHLSAAEIETLKARIAEAGSGSND
jgi:hypothetical protein